MTATATATARQAILTGDVVTARPWQNGREINEFTGIVIEPTWATDEFAIVWFPALGAPEIGSTVMPIMNAKISVAGTIADASDSARAYWRMAIQGSPLGIRKALPSLPVVEAQIG